MELREALEQAVEKVEKEDESTSNQSVGSTDATSGDGASASGNVDGGAGSESTGGDAGGADASGTGGTTSKDGTSGDDDGGAGSVQGSQGDAEGGDKKNEGADASSGENKNEEGVRRVSTEDSGGDDGQPRLRVDRPPQAWKGEVRQNWDTLPLTVRQEIVRRERSFDAAMRDSAGARDFAVGFQKVLEPYKDVIRGNPIVAIRDLLEADKRLRTSDEASKAKLVAKLIADYAVSVDELDKALAADPQSVAAGTPIAQTIRNEIRRELEPLRSQMRPQVQQQPQVDDNKLEREIVAMANDPKYEFLNDVLEDMADIIDAHARRGVAITAAQAYTKAVKINPEIAPIVEAREAEAKKRELARELNEKAQKAKKAASSVSGSAMGKTTTQISGNPLDLRATLEAAVSQVETGGGRL